CGSCLGRQHRRCYRLRHILWFQHCCWLHRALSWNYSAAGITVPELMQISLPISPRCQLFCGWPFSGCSLWPVWPVAAGCCCRPGNNFWQDKSTASFDRALLRYSLLDWLQIHFGVSGLVIIVFFFFIRSV